MTAHVVSTTLAWSVGGGFQIEVGWSIVDANGTVIASGGAPESGDICLPTGCYTLDMTDTWGDGWNGAHSQLTVKC